MKSLCEVLVVLFFFGCVTTARSMAGVIDSDKLNARVSQLVAKYNIPSAEIAIVKGDSVVYKFSKGMEGDTKNFLIGSCSKSFTALSILMLREKGLVDLDKPVITYLPWFRVKDGNSISLITVRHLLNHSSGIGSQYGFFDYSNPDFQIYKTKLIGHLTDVELVNVPGKAFCYSNLNYLLLGLVVEAVTNEKYGTFLTQNVFSRIGMKNSYAAMTKEVFEKNVTPYQYYFFNKPFKSQFYPHSEHALAYGYLSTNAADLSDYLSCLMNHGVTKSGDTLISAKSFRELTTPVNGHYTMGWMQMNYQNMDTFIHSGLDENFSAVLSFSPESKIGVVVLSNVNSLEFCSLVQSSIIDLIAQKPYFEPFSMEMVLRWLPDFLVLVALLLLLLNGYRWRKYGSKVGFFFRIFPLLRLIIGIFLSVLCIVLIQKTYGISIVSVIDFQPDIVWAVSLIAIFGITSSCLRFLGTFSKNLPCLRQRYRS